MNNAERLPWMVPDKEGDSSGGRMADEVKLLVWSRFFAADSFVFPDHSFILFASDSATMISGDMAPKRVPWIWSADLYARADLRVWPT